MSQPTTEDRPKIRLVGYYDAGTTTSIDVEIDMDGVAADDLAVVVGALGRLGITAAQTAQTAQPAPVVPGHLERHPADTAIFPKFHQ